MHAAEEKLCKSEYLKKKNDNTCFGLIFDKLTFVRFRNPGHIFDKLPIVRFRNPGHIFDKLPIVRS